MFLKWWMKVQLNPEWEAKVLSITPKVYLLSNKSQRFIDDNFDKIHKKRCLEFTFDSTFFSFSIFIVWKLDVQGQMKGCVIVVIQKLNKLVLSDSYFVFLQLEMIANVQDCTNLVVLDATFRFYH